jgi:hypothetical protein
MNNLLEAVLNDAESRNTQVLETLAINVSDNYLPWGGDV